MKISKPLIEELGEILEKEFNLKISGKGLAKAAYSLAGYFDLLLKIENRAEFGNSSARPIDTNNKLSNIEERK